jgi:hypothetical protein
VWGGDALLLSTALLQQRCGRTANGGKGGEATAHQGLAESERVSERYAGHVRAPLALQTHEMLLANAVLAPRASLARLQLRSRAHQPRVRPAARHGVRYTPRVSVRVRASESEGSDGSDGTRAEESVADELSRVKQAKVCGWREDGLEACLNRTISSCDTR